MADRFVVPEQFVVAADFIHPSHRAVRAEDVPAIVRAEVERVLEAFDLAGAGMGEYLAQRFPEETPCGARAYQPQTGIGDTFFAPSPFKCCTLPHGHRGGHSWETPESGGGVSASRPDVFWYQRHEAETLLVALAEDVLDCSEPLAAAARAFLQARGT